MVDQAPRDDLYISECQRRPGHLDEPQRQIPSEDLVPRQPSRKDHWNQWSPYNLILLQVEQTTGLTGQSGTGPPTEPWISPKVFFLRSVTDGVLVPLPLSPLACLVGTLHFQRVRLCKGLIWFLWSCPDGRLGEQSLHWGSVSRLI